MLDSAHDLETSHPACEAGLTSARGSSGARELRRSHRVTSGIGVGERLRVTVERIARERR